MKLNRNSEDKINRVQKRKFAEQTKQQDEEVLQAKKKKIGKSIEDKPLSFKLKINKNIPFTKKDLKSDFSDDDTVHLPTSTFRDHLIDNLKGSRFRYLNELLYNKRSNEATDVFQDDPTSFKAYHDGYRQQVQQWPLNPLDRMIKALKRL